jgi:hypothetical protein
MTAPRLNDNPYLQKLRALKSKRSLPHEPSKPSKPLPDVAETRRSTKRIHFEGFEGAQGMGFSDFEHPHSVGDDSTQDIRSGAPESPSPTNPQNLQNHFALVLAILEARCPEFVPMDCWQQAIADGKTFFGRWGEQAAALGWTARDLFGLPRSRTSRIRAIGGSPATTKLG